MTYNNDRAVEFAINFQKVRRAAKRATDKRYKNY